MSKYGTFVGRTAEGSRIFIEAALERQSLKGEWQTTTHETVTGEFLRLAITGSELRKGGSPLRDGDWVSFGVGVGVGVVTEPADGWTFKDLRKLDEIRKAWHLNDMNAGCVHQPPESVVYREGKYGREIDLDNTPACPVTGYRYGSAWLVTVLPADVEAWVRERFDITN